MRASRRLERVWLLLVGLTLGGAFLGEAAESGFLVTGVIASIMAVKGRLVIDDCMELSNASCTIRLMVRHYV